MTKRRKERRTTKNEEPHPTPPPTVVKAYVGPEYGYYFINTNVYNGYWPCELVGNEEHKGQLTGKLLVRCHSEDFTW
jgi:hypothetical protein